MLAEWGGGERKRGQMHQDRIAWQSLGLTPDRTDRTSLPSADEDLLAYLEHQWSAAAEVERGSVGARSRRIAARLRAWQRRGARLTWGIPGDGNKPIDPWLGQRLAWWPAGIPAGRMVGLISSRLGRELEARQRWFAALRTACMHLDHRHDLLVTARSISTQKYVQRAGELFGVRVLELEVADRSSGDPSRWGRSLLETDPETTDPSLRLQLSPPLQTIDEDAAWAPTPPADRAVVALSDRLIVLHARGSGNVQRLVLCRLNSDLFPEASVFLALGPDLVPPELAQPWMDAGAVGWYLQNTDEAETTIDPGPWYLADSMRSPSAPIRRLSGLPERDGLTHWTRRRQGPWPDQGPADYLDDLILDRHGADHSAFAALWRIVQHRRLVATSDLIRGAAPVVCFTQVPLAEWTDRRSFRPHLSRWDFEPFGIRIQRSWLSARGAEAVRYGDQDLWDALPEHQRPFFQKRFTRNDQGHTIDWSIEREWRHPGDLLLDELPSDSAQLFVPTLADARQIARISPWPVIVLE